MEYIIECPDCHAIERAQNIQDVAYLNHVEGCPRGIKRTYQPGVYQVRLEKGWETTDGIYSTELGEVFLANYDGSMWTTIPEVLNDGMLEVGPMMDREPLLPYFLKTPI